MKILTLRHTPEQKRELFGWIGEACADSAIRMKLGAPISSTPGDTWLVAVKGDEFLGMAGLHWLKSKPTVKLHGLYAEDPKVEARLRAAAVKAAETEGMIEITATDHESKINTYASEGWEAGAAKGQYRGFARRLNVTEEA